MASKEMQLIRQLRDPHNEIVVQAVEGLRAGGWLGSGTLQGLGLRCAHLQGADLHSADLREVDLRMANLRGADLSAANLQGTRLNRANLRGADLSAASLQGADLFDADLEGACNLSDEQFAQVSRLRAAKMLDGSRYDGRFDLEGDLRDADLLHVDINDPVAMADFYGISLEEYRSGQAWAQESLVRVRGEAEAEAAELVGAEVQLIRRLRTPDNAVALEAVAELRARELLSGGMLKGTSLQNAQLQGADLSLANLEGADLGEVNLQDAELGVANLQGANLRKANLQGAGLLWAGLQGADLTEANLQGANLAGANLQGARLNHANLRGAEFSLTNLQEADLYKADLAGAYNVSEEELAKAHRLWGATLPDGSLYDGRFNLEGDAEFARKQ
jgi:uncharacterized protein YjbI with pentapeptide repeats